MIIIGIVGIFGYLIASPSIAAATDIGGVIIPSASMAEPPSSAGIRSHRLRLFTRE